MLYFIYDLFIDDVSNSAYTAPNGRVSKELERMWKEAVVASFEDRNAK
jgi:hypothetical protein